MTPKERVQAVLEGRTPDKVPLHHISFSSRIASRILGRDAYVGGGINQWREADALWKGPDAHAEFLERTRRDSIDIALACDLDLVRPGYWRDRRKPAARIDDLTFRYEGADGSWEVMQLDPETELYNTIARSPQSQPALGDLERIVEQAEERAARYEVPPELFAGEAAALERIGRTHAVRCAGPWSAIPVGEPAWMEAALLRPDLVARLLDTQVVTSIRNVEHVARLGGTLCFGGGDFASDLGPMYSPAVFRELLLPRVRRISDACRRLGVRHFFGTDGNLWPVADDFYRESRIDGHYEVDRRAGMDIRRIHERYPHITLVGNISSFTLHTGSAGDVVAETRACLDEARATNKVIVGCSNIIICETPMRNVDALMETMAKYR